MWSNYDIMNEKKLANVEHKRISLSIFIGTVYPSDKVVGPANFFIKTRFLAVKGHFYKNFDYHTGSMINRQV
jgi:hypothetical protein